MPVRYTLEYPDSQPHLFRCYVERERGGWSAQIFDLRQNDENTKKPLQAFIQFVDGPEDGIPKVEIMLSRLLKRNNIPEQEFSWSESS